MPSRTRRPGVAVDGGVLRHQVVAALGVVVVLADLADEDVVARRLLGGVVEERRAVVALQQVLAGTALDPVVPGVAEHGVGALTGDDEVLAGSGERLVVVGAALEEVLAVAAHVDVVAGAGVEASLPGPPLRTSAPSRSVMMSLPSPPSAMSSPPLPSMMSLPGPPQKVSLSLPPMTRSARCAVVDRLPVDAGGIDGVAWAVLDRAVGLAEQQLALVAVRRRRVVEDRATPLAREFGRHQKCGWEPGRGGRRRLGQLELAVRGANASAFSVFVPSVLRPISSENELPSSWVRRFMPGVRAR